MEQSYILSVVFVIVIVWAVFLTKSVMKLNRAEELSRCSVTPEKWELRKLVHFYAFFTENGVRKEAEGVNGIELVLRHILSRVEVTEGRLNMIEGTITAEKQNA